MMILLRSAKKRQSVVSPQESRVEERLRFTGENPPVRLWARFPNWQNAYEEEGLPGQDETTLRPADNQQMIDNDVSFTAGEAVMANGQRFPAMLGVLSGELGWVYVYPEPSQDVCWVLSFHVPSQRWAAMNDDWFLQGSAVMRVPVGDSAMFPIRVASRLPLERTGEIIAAEIEDPG
jgi:hypothetical protein